MKPTFPMCKKNWRPIILVKYRYTTAVLLWRIIEKIHVMSPNSETCTHVYVVCKTYLAWLWLTGLKLLHISELQHCTILLLILIKTTQCTIHSWLKVFLRFFNIFFFPTGKSWRSTLSSTESLHLPCISLFRPDRFSRPGHLKNDFLMKAIPTFYVPKIPVNVL